MHKGPKVGVIPVWPAMNDQQRRTDAYAGNVQFHSADINDSFKAGHISTIINPSAEFFRTFPAGPWSRWLPSRNHWSLLRFKTPSLTTSVPVVLPCMNQQRM